MIADLRNYYENQPIALVRQRLRETKDFLHCLKIMVDEGCFEEAHLLPLRTISENRLMVLEEIIRVSEETIRALRS